MVNTLKISIVTISYNQAAFLPACLESVLEQDYKDIEYIVVDAGSSDGSREIINKYSCKIDKIIFEPDKGPADGLNKGFSHATGDIFCYINADDILLPGAISCVVEKFIQSSDTDVLYGNGLQIDEKGHIVRKIYSTDWNLRFYAYGACNIVQQATFFRRKIFKQAGQFNVANKICWDGELLVDMALAGAKYTRTSKILGGFRVYNNSITGSGMHQSKLFIDTTQRITTKILGRSKRKYDKTLILLYRFFKCVKHPIVTFHNARWKIRRKFITNVS